MAYRKKSPAERIAELEEREQQVKRQLQAERAKLTDQKRKDDTRRKIIAGALVLEHAQKNPNDETGRTLHRLIQSYVTKPDERRLFGLNPLPAADQPEETRSETHAENTPPPH